MAAEFVYQPQFLQSCNNYNSDEKKTDEARLGWNTYSGFPTLAPGAVVASD